MPNKPFKMPRAGPQPPLPGSHVHVLCAWRKAWRRCSHQLTMSPPGRGTVEKEGRLSVWDCVFSQQAGIYHICNLKHQCRGTFPAVHTFTAGGMGLIPGWGPEIPHAIRCRKKKKEVPVPAAHLAVLLPGAHPARTDVFQEGSQHHCSQ